MKIVIELVFSIRSIFLGLLLLLLHVNFTAAQSIDYTIQLTDEDENVSFEKLPAIYWNDTTCQKEIGDIQMKSFLQASPAYDVHVKPGECRWYTVSIKNQSSRNWLLEFPDAHISQVELYRELEGGGFEFYPISGKDFDHSERSFPHKNHVFQLKLSEGKSTRYFMKVQSIYPSSTRFHLRSVHYFVDYALLEYCLLGAFYGMLVIMMVYSFMMFLSTRDKLYLNYILYLLGCVIYTSGEDSLLGHLLWSDMPVFGKLAFDYGPVIWITGFILFSNAFLSLRKRNALVFYLMIVAYLMFVISSTFHFTWHYWLMVVIVLFAVIEGFKMWRAGTTYARYFVIGYVLVLIGLTVFVLRVFNVLETTLFTYYATYDSFMIEALVFAMAMSDKIKQIKIDKELAQNEVIIHLKQNEQLKDKVNRELETKVSERTQELQEKTNELVGANAKLEQLSQELHKMNAAMDKENWQLQRTVKEAKRQKVEQKSLSFIEFQDVYPSNDACMKYLAERKWGKGYRCKKCKNEKFMGGEKRHARKCTKCKYDESPMIDTVFQGVRFDLLKAFFIAYHTVESKEKMTMDELSDTLELRRNTCWSFKKKVEARQEESKAEYWQDVVVGK